MQGWDQDMLKTQVFLLGIEQAIIGEGMRWDWAEVESLKWNEPCEIASVCHLLSSQLEVSLSKDI